ncbi:MAG: membrane protein insertase YidC [Planctomycetota bacterium]
MPHKPNKALRLAVPLILTLVGIGVAASVLISTQKPNPRSGDGSPAGREVALSESTAADTQPADAPPIDTPPTDAPLTDAPPTDGPPTPADEPEPAEPSADEPAGDTTGSQGTVFEDSDSSDEDEPGLAATDDEPALRWSARPAAQGPLTPIGSLDAAGPYSAQITFTPIGAGIATYRLAGEFQTVDDRTDARLGEDVPDAAHVEVQSLAALSLASGGTAQTPPFAALWLEVDGPKNRVFLTTAADGIASVWEEEEPGSFRAVIEDENGDEVLVVRRRFILDEGSYDVRVEQSVVNLTDTPRRVRLVQFGPIDLPPDRLTYGGDKRRFRIGYLLKPASDPTRGAVVTDGYLKRRESGFVLGKKGDNNRYTVDKQIWPNADSERREHELVWIGTTGRYFGVAVHPDFDPAALPKTGKAIRSIETVDRVMLDTADRLSPIVLRLASPSVELSGKDAAADFGYRFYAGPLSTSVIAEHPVADASGLEKLVVYNFGGPLAFCTLQSLTALLIGTLRTLHGFFGDYALAIIALVVVVRSLLHPITRWSQIRIQRSSKQMSDIKPEMDKLRERFKDDPQRLQQETANLWRENNINPAGCVVGMLPMFLQSFIWIALYATLFFAYELRHEPAFYGLFQTVTGGEWSFLADMASPDALVRLPESLHFDLPLMGTIRSFNVFPLIYAGVFFFQQKYLRPPTTGTLTPEQEQQQKIIQIMLPIMFPIIIYNAPSGLAVYMFFSASLNILENIWIRHDIKRKNLLEVPAKAAKPAKPRKPRKQGGFLARLEKLAEEQKRLQEEKLRQQYRQAGYKARNGPGGKKESAAERLRRKK